MSTYDEYVSTRYTQEYTPTPDELPADHWSKTVDEKDLQKRIAARSAAGNTVQSLAPTSIHAAGVKSTHDIHAAHFIVEYGAKPQRDMTRINAYLKLRAERARRAKQVRAAATGPRPDELEGVILPQSSTSGAVNPCATGPLPVEWKEPESRPVPVFRIAESKRPSPEPVKPKEVEGTLIGTSAIGAKVANKWAATPCGPTPVEWVDPAAKK